MSIRSQFLLFTLPLVRLISAPAPGQEMAEQSAGRNVMQMKFGAVPDCRLARKERCRAAIPQREPRSFSPKCRRDVQSRGIGILQVNT